MINKNALSLHIDIDPRKSLSIIHYGEFMVGVPHRFTKNLTNLLDLMVKKEDQILSFLSFFKAQIC